jgi:hypothetical protein
MKAANMKSMIQKIVEHVRYSVRWTAVAILAVVLAYRGGLWLSVVHNLGGVAEVGEPPLLVHWLRDSTLMLPLVLAAVVAGLLIARRMLDGYADPHGLMANLVVIVTIAVVTSTAEGIASPLHNILFPVARLVGGHHRAVGEDLPLVTHMVYDGSLALIANAVITAVIFVLLNGNVWTWQTRRRWADPSRSHAEEGGSPKFEPRLQPRLD